MDWAEFEGREWTDSERPTAEYPLCSLLADVAEALENEDE